MAPGGEGVQVARALGEDAPVVGGDQPVRMT